MAHKYWKQKQDKQENSDLKINASEVGTENLSSYPEYTELPNEDMHSTHDTIIAPALNRPPQPPEHALGPYFQFITTDLEKMLWIGSALIFRHVSLDRPKIKFFSEANVNYDWDVLYEDLFNMRAYRINLQIELRTGKGDEKVAWIIDWGDYSTGAMFYIARYDQKWRGGFFSCNGFDASVPKQTVDDLNYDNVWNHLQSIHEETPLHILLWGGDQTYIDFIFEDIPFLKDWTQMEWDQKWTHAFDDDCKTKIEEYYFNACAENWERRLEIKRALQSTPSLMMWDDHDIFDGAGSYPPPLHDSPVMLGLFTIAQKMRLLFQHHTTPEKARQHGFFGYQGYNYFARCGPKLAILGTDGRSERDIETVQHEKTWDMIFDKLDNNLQGVEQLIVLSAVPISFVRSQFAESVFEYVKNLPSKWKNMTIIKQNNSIFDLPELYDDLLDEWTHTSHLAERNLAVQRFQEMAEKKKVRITFFSGDVHCCGISRFQTSGKNVPLPIHDARLMYQVISSAIVNMPPSEATIRMAHFGTTKWYPFKNTEEEVINFFEWAPGNGRKLFLQKLLPNRNWCYFEQGVTTNPTTPTPPVQNGLLNSFFSWYGNNLSIDSKLDRNKQEDADVKIQANASVYPKLSVVQEQQEINCLKVRLWLESSEKQKDGRRFAGYNLFIPNLD
jgi:hypothetical protein